MKTKKLYFVFIISAILTIPLAFALREVGSFEGSLDVGSDGGVINIGPGNGTQQFCGNGIVEEGEQCDSSIRDKTCASILGQGFSGNLKCSNLCRWDTSLCVAPNVTNGNGGNGGNGGGGGGSSGRASFFYIQKDNETNVSRQQNGGRNGNGFLGDLFSPFIPLNDSEKNETPRGIFGITGAIIGALGPVGTTAIILFIIALVAAFIVIKNLRQDKAPKFNNKKISKSIKKK